MKAVADRDSVNDEVQFEVDAYALKRANVMVADGAETTDNALSPRIGNDDEDVPGDVKTYGQRE